MNPNLLFHQGKDSYFFFLKIFYKLSKINFFTQFLIFSRKLIASKKDYKRLRAGFLKRQKIPFSSITQRGIFPKMILDSFFLSFFFFEILML